VSVVDTDTAELVDALERDEMARLEQTVLHVRNQVGGAGHVHRVTGVFSHDSERLRNRALSVIPERW